MSIHIHDVLAVCKISCNIEDHIILYDPGHQVIIPEFFPNRVRVTRSPHSFLANQAELVNKQYLVFSTSPVYSWMLIEKPVYVVCYNARVKDLSFYYQQQYHLHFKNNRLELMVPDRSPRLISRLLVKASKAGLVNVFSDLQKPSFFAENFPAVPSRIRISSTVEKASARLEEKSGSQWVVKDHLDVNFKAACTTNLVQE